jgi:hypothetical protein
VVVLMKYLEKRRFDYAKESERLLTAIGNPGGNPEMVVTLEYPRLDHPNHSKVRGSLERRPFASATSFASRPPSR